MLKLYAGGRGVDRRTRAELLARLEQDALRICARFRLRYRVLEAERANVKRRYGVCYSDGTIRIRLRHATSGKPLKYSSLVNTLCHELAHLKHFNHGPRFQSFYAQILEWARRERIYQPGRRDGSAVTAAIVAERAHVATAIGPVDAMQKTRAGPDAEGAADGAQAPTQLDLFG